MTQNFGLSMNYNSREYINKYYYTVQSSRNLYRLSLPNYSSDLTQYRKNLSSQFLKDLTLLNTGNLIPRTIFKTYGTHLIASAYYGGNLDMYYSIMSNQINYSSQIIGEFNNGINASINNIGVNNNVGLNFEANSTLNQANLKTGYYSQARGGAAFTSLSSFNFQASYTNWINSINSDNSVITHFATDGLIPIWDILPENFVSVKKQLQAEYPYYLSDIYNENKITDYDSNKYLSKPVNLSEKLIRLNEKIITDKGILNNHFDEINLKNLYDVNTDVLKSYGFKRYTVQLYLDIAEIDDGYQRIYLYSNNTQLFYNEIEHTPGKKNASISTYNFNSDFYDINTIAENKLYIRYDAAGTFSDNWKASNIRIKINFYG